MLQVALRVEIPSTHGDLITGYPGEQFGGSHPEQEPKSYRGASVEVSVPLDRARETLDLLLETVNQHPFVAPLAFRYVKNSKATLAFTQYAPTTVTIEMPGYDDPFNHAARGHQAVFEALQNSNIPHSYHWGQAFPDNKQWVINSYGTEKIAAWKQQRLQRLGEKGCYIFANQLVASLGLA